MAQPRVRGAAAPIDPFLHRRPYPGPIAQIYLKIKLLTGGRRTGRKPRRAPAAISAMLGASAPRAGRLRLGKSPRQGSAMNTVVRRAVRRGLALLALALIAVPGAHAASPPAHVAINAEFGPPHSTSAQAIEDVFLARFQADGPLAPIAAR